MSNPLTDTVDAHLVFEAVKLGLSQDKNGLVLKLSIHPNDMPKDVMTDPLGARYKVGIVRLSDDEKPMIPKEKDETEKLISRAYALCRNPRFGEWLRKRAGDNDTVSISEFRTRTLLLRLSNISSRTELRSNTVARSNVERIFQDFDEAVRRGNA